MKFIKLVVILILIVSVIYISISKLKEILKNDIDSESNQLQEDLTTLDSDDIVGEYFSLDNNGIIVAKYNNAETTLIDQNDSVHFKSTEELLIDNNFDGIINAGYFQQDYSHAGLLIHEGTVKSQIAPTDKQLTHVLQFDPKFNVYSGSEFFEMADDEVNGNNYIQVGPLVIENGVYTEEYILNSVNGNGLYLRTLFGYDLTNNIYLIYTTKQYDLKSLADLLLSSEIFKDKKATIINLDGGTSVSAFTDHSIIFNYQKLKKLPYYIGVRVR